MAALLARRRWGVSAEVRLVSGVRFRRIIVERLRRTRMAARRVLRRHIRAVAVRGVKGLGGKAGHSAQCQRRIIIEVFIVFIGLLLLLIAFTGYSVSSRENC